MAISGVVIAEAVFCFGIAAIGTDEHIQGIDQINAVVGGESHQFHPQSRVNF